MKNIVVIAIIAVILSLGGLLVLRKKSVSAPASMSEVSQAQEVAKDAEPLHPLAIEAMRKKSYPGSDFVIEETLAKGSNYNRYIASYISDGFKIYGLLTIPNTPKPQGGYPAIVFLHGYLAPETYQTLERYVQYQDNIARSGYITFKPDLRGHGRSEGESVTATFSDVYVTDALNVAAAFKKHPDVNPEKIGMWGHSMGGGITLRSMVISQDIKAGVIWAGVVTNYDGLWERYQRRNPFGSPLSSASQQTSRQFYQEHGSPSANRKFWNTVDPYNYLADISGPIQLHHGTADDSVPVEYSDQLKTALERAGKPVENYIYQGADHNISGAAYTQAMQRTIAFFDTYLK